MTFQLTDFDVDTQAAQALLATIHAAAFAPMDERGWSALEFRAMVETPGVYVVLATADDEPVGFVLYRLVLDEAELITVAVLPNWQGQGVALRLIDHMIFHLKGMKVTKVFLEVRADNGRAIVLYQRIGFCETGKRPAYYQTQSGNRIDALCLCLFLNNSTLSKEK
jgi:ribosomal-protein-alanine N-acetyltransferase